MDRNCSNIFSAKRSTVISGRLGLTRTLKIYYRFSSEFNEARTEGYVQLMSNILQQRRKGYFYLLKSKVSGKEKRIKEMESKLDKMERILSKRNEIFGAFNYIKLARGKERKGILIQGISSTCCSEPFISIRCSPNSG